MSVFIFGEVGRTGSHRTALLVKQAAMVANIDDVLGFCASAPAADNDDACLAARRVLKSAGAGERQS